MSNIAHGGERPVLIVFAGLPGVGKTTVSRRVASGLGAVHLRVDTIEQAICGAAVLRDGVEGSGYAVAQALAVDNLALGRSVVADCVNPVPESREAWRAVAVEAGVRIIEIEVVCSDPVEHRRRVESRAADIAGHALPSWDDVLRRDYRAWDDAPVVLDSAHARPEELAEAVLRAVRSP